MQELFKDQMLETIPCLAGNVVGEGLKTIQIAPWGRVNSRKGTFIIDEESSGLIVSSFAEHETPLVIDYEHQTLGGEYASPDGRAPAAGFIHKLWREPGRGIYAFVEWNPKAKATIQEGEYRYLSPVVAVRKADRRAVALHSVGLTNKPAIPGMGRVVASENEPLEMELHAMTEDANEQTPADKQEEGKDMEGKVAQVELKNVYAILRKMKEFLKIEGTVSRLAVLKAALKKIAEVTGNPIDESKDGSDGSEDAAVASSVREVLGLSSDAGWSEVVLAMATRDTSGATEQLTAMREAETERVAKDRVDYFVKINRINPFDKKQYAAAMSLARENPERFEELMAMTVPHVPPGRITPLGGRPSGGRQTVIANAARQYKDNPDLQKTCGMDASVNMALREAGLATMTEDEAREFVTT